jgi:hypothetical protein
MFIEQLGIDNADQLIAYTSTTSPERGTVTLYLTGDHPALPVLKVGEEVPQAQIVSEKIQSRIEIPPHKSGN